MDFGPDRWRLYRLSLREAGRAMRESMVWSLSRLSSAPVPTRLLFAPQDLRTADPTIATSNFAWANASPVGNQVGFYNNASASWAALSGALSVTTASHIAPACVILRLQAGSSFSGLAGGIGYLHLGASASIALNAEL